MKYDKIQLLKDAFACRETFKVPTGFWHHFVLGPDQFRADRDAAIRDRIVEGHRRYYELVNPDMMKMMNGFTVLRLTGLMGAMDVRFTKEQLLEMNERLNQIKKP